MCGVGDLYVWKFWPYAARVSVHKRGIAHFQTQFSLSLKSLGIAGSKPVYPPRPAASPRSSQSTTRHIPKVHENEFLEQG